LRAVRSCRLSAVSLSRATRRHARRRRPVRLLRPLLRPRLRLPLRRLVLLLRPPSLLQVGRCLLPRVRFPARQPLRPDPDRSCRDRASPCRHLRKLHGPLRVARPRISSGSSR
jgi:hypothetical protein